MASLHKTSFVEGLKLMAEAYRTRHRLTTASGKRFVWHGDCRKLLRDIDSASIDSVVTDPPYGIGYSNLSWDSPWNNYAHMSGEKWDDRRVAFKRLMTPVGKELFRVLKEGSFLVAFGDRKTAHWLASSLEVSGFVIRDQLHWFYRSKVECEEGGSDRSILKSKCDVILLAQKPKSIFVFGLDLPGLKRLTEVASESEEPEVLIDRHHRIFVSPKASDVDSEEGCSEFPLLPGPSLSDDPQSRYKVKRMVHNAHPTVKPTALMRELVRMVTPPGGLVIDPFCGSGSTGKACVKDGYGFIGIEQDRHFADIAFARISSAEWKGE